MKSIAIIIAMILWTLFSWQWYTCGIYGKCYFTIGTSSESDSVNADSTTSNSLIVEIDSAGNNKPILFSFDEYEPLIDSTTFELYRDSIVNIYKNHNIVLVTGLYDSSESNSSSFDDIGLARATQVKKLLSSELHPTKIHVDSRSSELIYDGSPSMFRAIEIGLLMAEGATPNG